MSFELSFIYSTIFLIRSFCCQLQCYYDRLLCHSLVRSDRYSTTYPNFLSITLPHFAPPRREWLLQFIFVNNNFNKELFCRTHEPCLIKSLFNLSPPFRETEGLMMRFFFFPFCCRYSRFMTFSAPMSMLFYYFICISHFGQISNVWQNV